ncbi:MAG TPA: hypothetical protein VNI83_09825, partial [Vicinamibacterales bacterium]|nr:hypothetical protein [Vicinamibacterales bacterium]
SIHLEWSSATVPSCCHVEVAFGRNAANTPVTLLVKGDVTITSLGAFSVRGDNGVGGSFDAPGRGGLGGPGGFRGGDGAYQMVNLANNGGAGLGPGGGSPGIGTTAPPTAGGNATFLASPDLLPLVGGSGGGGGASTSASAGCSGGGGGGGGGAILIAANGTITIDGSIIAEGGDRGFNASSTCASAGGGGSGGALRLVASSITGTGSLLARGGVNASGVRASPGSIRIEALSNSFPMVSNADPDAVGSLPGPIVNPLTPTVAITAVGGQPVPQPPQGGYGAIDVQIPAPGPTAIDLRTSGVPAGTTVEVKVKPRVGGTPATGQATLGSCDAAGVCQGSVTFDLPAGSYVIEARATFQTG